ncbi:DUF4166 domain-containing protein [Rhodobacterales bacterium HKCCE2091]|nr:DUF4166 domain-containing protein [Rhodobacterales bacterium HKCCE2091]
MTVAILGGTGVFGSRLARLLRRDGREVVLVSRTGGSALAAEIGAGSLALDRAGDLGPLFALSPKVVVDAAGPFQDYGGDYRLARACIAAGVNYLDFSDDAGFCAGISALDAEARAAGVFVLSGVSSVPALSSAVVAELAAGLERVEAIEAAILPGNRAPRGRSVMAGILGAVGRPVRVFEGGAWEERPGWSDPALYVLPGGTRRRAWLTPVPDLELFPAAFGARTVRFRAGLELGVMGWGLAALSLLRRAVPVPVPVGPVKWLADRLDGFGTDVGGMVVAVTGHDGRGFVQRRWRLLAEAGEGPFVPAVPARALIAAGAAPGARAAIAELPLPAFEGAMADLSVRFERDETPVAPLFAEVLGDRFASLPPAVRDSHATVAVSRLAGEAEVTRGAGAWPRVLAALFRLPPAAARVPVTVVKTRTAAGETWERRFGAGRFRSHLSAERGRMVERFGPFRFTLGLHVAEGALHFPVLSARVGPVPLPRWALPGSVAAEREVDGRFRFDVALHAPLTGGLVVRYRGWLERV